MYQDGRRGELNFSGELTHFPFYCPKRRKPANYYRGRGKKGLQKHLMEKNSGMIEKRGGGLRKQQGNHDILSPPNLKISTPEDHPETPLESKGT